MVTSELLNVVCTVSSSRPQKPQIVQHTSKVFVENLKPQVRVWQLCNDITCLELSVTYVYCFDNAYTGKNAVLY